ncbi:hypothetical protein X975_27163, partial [Stegodyphus mimosarum]
MPELKHQSTWIHRCRSTRKDNYKLNSRSLAQLKESYANFVNILGSLIILLLG